MILHVRFSCSILKERYFVQPFALLFIHFQDLIIVLKVELVELLQQVLVNDLLRYRKIIFVFIYLLSNILGQFIIPRYTILFLPRKLALNIPYLCQKVTYFLIKFHQWKSPIKIWSQERKCLQSPILPFYLLVCDQPVPYTIGVPLLDVRAHYSNE